MRCFEDHPPGITCHWALTMRRLENEEEAIRQAQFKADKQAAEDLFYAGDFLPRVKKNVPKGVYGSREAEWSKKTPRGEASHDPAKRHT
jgi:hypothetical protein